MTTISVRISDEDLVIFKNYAKINNTSLSELIRSTLIERIEDEYDISVFKEFEKQKAEGTLKTRPINELWEELEL